MEEHFRRVEGNVQEIKWNDRFKIGVESIDKAHERLFSIVNKLIRLNEEDEKSKHVCREGIKFFKSYTIKHFIDEEAYMQSIDYSEYEMHKHLHDNLRDKTLPALEKELEAHNYSTESVQHFLGICIGWLNAHIMVEDFAIAGRTANKWIHQAAEDEVESLEKAVDQAFHSLFRLKSQIVSENYSGEKFSEGNVLCYRLTYSSAEGKKLHTYLIYEESMVLFALGEVLGKPIKRVDKTVTYAMKLLSQKVMDSIGSHFEVTREYRFEKNDMLTFDLLLKTFYKSYPPYSLLFDMSGKGYFGLCIDV